MHLRWISLFSLLSILLAGCGASQLNTVDHSDSTSPAPNETEPLSSPRPVTSKQWDDMPIDPPLPIPTNPGLEALMEKAKADLAQRSSIDASQIKAVETREAFWPDTSLGCPQPGVTYAQIVTPGYVIVLAHSGDEFEYHADIHGNTIYCENPTPLISATP